MSNTRIQTLYFDEQGRGPVALEIEPFPFPDLPERPLGLRFHLAPGEIEIVNSPAGGGLFMSRQSVADLHAEIGAWLAATPVAT